jgi:hypothetical protein
MSHLPAELLLRWRARSASATEILAATDHLETCADCRDALSGPGGTEAFADALDFTLERERAEPFHPTPAQLESWVDGRSESSETELIESHAAVCERCRATAEDLRHFSRSLLAGRPRSRRSWASLAAAGLVLAFGAALWQRGATAPAGPERALSGSGSTSLSSPPPPPERPLLRDGDLRIDADGTVSGLPERWRSETLALLDRPELPTPALARDLLRSAGRIRGGETDGADAARGVVEPVSRVVLDSRPEFRWQGSAAVAYRVEVFGPGFVPVATSPPTAAQTWRTEQPLPRGVLLTWKVTAIDAAGGESMFPRPPAPPAVFRIASAEAVEEIEAARATRSRLLVGMALWRAGLLEDAADELVLLGSENPEFEPARALAIASRQGVAELASLRPPLPSVRR